MKRRSVWSTAALALISVAASADVTVTITNTLGLAWPWDRVWLEAPAGMATDGIAVGIGGELRPVQVEIARAQDGAPQTQLWFVASIPGGEKRANVVFMPGAPVSPLRVEQGKDAVLVLNSAYRFSIPQWPGVLKEPMPLSRLPGPIGAVSPAGSNDAWCGESVFKSDCLVTAAYTRVTCAGPVFATVVLDCLGVSTATNAALAGPAWYRIAFTFTAGDAWIDVEESYRMPPSEWSFSVRDGVAFDTVMWVRWFGWEGFGGNNQLNYVAMTPDPKQRGPFVTLQPVWVQVPGHGQDFFVTRGGAPPGKDGKRSFEPSPYEPEAPALGFVATRASRWWYPYEQKIRCHAEDGNAARIEFPLSGLDKPAEQPASRTWAFCIGPRRLYDSTGRMNQFIRRHCDWTLNDQIHNTILEWERDPARAGPNILIGKARLARLQADYKADADTPEMRVVHEFEKPGVKLSNDEKDFLKLLRGEPVAPRGVPDAGMWLGSRYQDDFLNPTTFTRRIGAGLPWADLFGGGKPIGGAGSAALGYVFTDLNHWPGWANGWHPGNPNFDTDKYKVAIYAAAAMADHPHAGRWWRFGLEKFEEDIRRTLLPPDGVAYECPGYSLVSLNMQLDLARVFRNMGVGNPVSTNSLFKATGTYHRNLLTPLDPRIGIRHQAPIGDTHRWGQHEGATFGRLAAFYAESDPAFASEMMGIWKLFRGQGMDAGFFEQILNLDLSIPPMAPEKMQWGSRAFDGFGAVLRSRFGDPRETFVSFKAGRIHGHYHNDDLSYHFYGAGMPLSLDYNCSYGPRGDHAALHNSMTFGVEAPFRHKGATHDVPAMEQLHGRAEVLAFRATDEADIVVAQRGGGRLSLSPIYPTDSIFGYGYPRRDTGPIAHRRFLALVKHGVGSRINDYLFVRDETRTGEPQQINIHLLARAVEQDSRTGGLFRVAGQWSADAYVFLADTSSVRRTEVRCWYYSGHGDKSPITEEAGRAFIPPEGHTNLWTAGEYQKWLRVETEPSASMSWVLYPFRRGDPEPVFRADGDGIEVSVGSEKERIAAATSPAAAGGPQAVVVRDGKETVLLPPSTLPALR